MTHTEKAVNYFSQKLHCSQSVLASFADECGITEEQAIKLGSCFGTGMRKGEVCGAVTGSLMVLGLMYGQNKVGDAEGRQRANKVDDLIGCDVRTMEGVVQYCLDNKLFTDFCQKMVAVAVEVVEIIMKF